MAEFNKISDDFYVCGQLSPNEIDAVVKAGFRSVICNRPDKEMPFQPASGDIFELANGQGLETAYLPMGMGQLSHEMIAATADALAQLPKPVLAYCGSGKRAAVLWCFANVKDQGCDAVLNASKTGGYDISDLRPMLDSFDTST